MHAQKMNPTPTSPSVVVNNKTETSPMDVLIKLTSQIIDVNDHVKAGVDDGVDAGVNDDVDTSNMDALVVNNDIDTSSVNASNESTSQTSGSNGSVDTSNMDALIELISRTSLA